MAKPATDGLAAMTSGMIAANPAIARAWSEIMSEGARFLSKRLQEDLETQKALLACRTPADVVQVQTEFFRKAMEQYTAETQRMFEIMTGAIEEAVKEAGTGTKRDFDDVPV